MLWFSSYVIVFEFSWKVKEKKIGCHTYWLTLVLNEGQGRDFKEASELGNVKLKSIFKKFPNNNNLIIVTCSLNLWIFNYNFFHSIYIYFSLDEVGNVVVFHVNMSLLMWFMEMAVFWHIVNVGHDIGFVQRCRNYWPVVHNLIMFY